MLQTSIIEEDDSKKVKVNYIYINNIGDNADKGTVGLQESLYKEFIKIKCQGITARNRKTTRRL